MIEELLSVADALVLNAPQRTAAELRRGVSTAYYALFHALAHDAADIFAGTVTRDDDAWIRVYRALDHGSAIRACRQIEAQDFGPEITLCSALFAQLQDARHAADYDPLLELEAIQATLLVHAAHAAIAAIRSAPRHERQRFAVYLLFKKR